MTSMNTRHPTVTAKCMWHKPNAHPLNVPAEPPSPPPTLEEAEDTLAKAMKARQEASERVSQEASAQGGVVEKGSEASQLQREADREYRRAERDFWRAYQREHRIKEGCPIEAVEEDILDPIERKILTNLKGYGSVYDSVEATPTGEILRGSDAAKVSSAFGNYAVAVGLRHGLSPQEVEQIVPSNTIDCTEEELLETLKSDHLRKQEEERIATKNELTLASGMAAHVQRAISKFEEATKKRRPSDVLHPMEKVILQNLKAYAALYERQEAQRNEGRVIPGGTAAKFESAAGHYAQALAFIYRLTPREVQALVPVQGPTVSENQLLDMLREDLGRKRLEEKYDPAYMKQIIENIEQTIIRFENAVYDKEAKDPHAMGPNDMEMRILRNLKARESLWSKKLREEAKGTGVVENIHVQKGSALSLLQSAFGLYAQAVAKDNFMAVQRVEQMVPKDVIDMDDKELLEALKEEAERKEEEEKKATKGLMDWGIAEKVKRAAEEFEIAIRLLQREE